MDRMDSPFLTTENAPQKDGDEFTLIRKEVVPQPPNRPLRASWTKRGLARPFLEILLRFNPNRLEVPGTYLSR